MVWRSRLLGRGCYKKGKEMKKQGCYLALSILAMSLVGCTTVNDPSKGAGVVDGNAGVETSGLGSDDFDAMGAGRRVCTLKVENQTYYFDFDSNRMHTEDRASVDVQGRYLASHAHARVVLEGHTDPRGSREYNVGLGERRAKSVAEILKLDGANNDQIRIVSYGAEKLAAAGHTEEDYQLDRRVNLIYEEK